MPSVIPVHHTPVPHASVQNEPHAQDALQVLQDLQQPGTLPPEALSPNPAASAHAVSAALSQLTEPPSRALARGLYLLARDEQKHLARAAALLGPVLREALDTRLRMHERLEDRMEHWLCAEAFRGNVPRQMQGALIHHLQSTRAMGRLLQEVDQFQLAGVMLRWQVTQNAARLALCNAPPGDETAYYRRRLATLLGAFNRADTLQSCRDTLDKLWASITALERHKSSQPSATGPARSLQQALTDADASPPTGDLDLSRDLDLASITEGHSAPSNRPLRRLPALLEHPPHRSTSALLQPPSDLERPWRQARTVPRVTESTDL